MPETLAHRAVSRGNGRDHHDLRFPKATIVLPEWVPPKRSGTMAVRKHSVSSTAQPSAAEKHILELYLGWMNVSRGAHILSGMIPFKADVESNRACWELLGGCDASGGSSRFNHADDAKMHLPGGVEMDMAAHIADIIATPADLDNSGGDPAIIELASHTPSKGMN